MVHGGLAALAQAARRVAAAPRPRKAALELTDAAVERVKELLHKRNKVGGSTHACMAAGRCRRLHFLLVVVSWLLPD